MPTPKILKIFLLAGLLTTTIGAVSGVIGGIWMAKNINRCIQFVEMVINFFIGIYYQILIFFSSDQFTTIPNFSIFPEGVYYLDELNPAVSFGEITIVLLIALFLGILAGLVPAFKAAKLKPLSIIRYE